MVAEIMPFSIVAGMEMVSRPLTKVTKKLEGMDAVVVKVKVMPGEAGMPWVAIRVGKALNGSMTLVLGQPVMKAAARV